MVEIEALLCDRILLKHWDRQPDHWYCDGGAYDNRQPIDSHKELQIPKIFVNAFRKKKKSLICTDVSNIFSNKLILKSGNCKTITLPRDTQILNNTYMSTTKQQNVATCTLTKKSTFKLIS